jgi:hypothetical protein
LNVRNTVAGPGSATGAGLIGAKTATITGSAGDWYNGTVHQASISIG